MPEKPLSCPFCDGPTSIYEDHRCFVMCMHCRNCGTSELTTDRAVQSWNRQPRIVRLRADIARYVARSNELQAQLMREHDRADRAEQALAVALAIHAEHQ